MMTTFVAAGIRSPTSEVIGVKMGWKGNTSKEDLFSGMNGKVNGWNMEGKRLLPTWGLLQACFQHSGPLLAQSFGMAPKCKAIKPV